MARNKYDVDEQLETPFDIRHFKRALVYVGKYKKQVIISMLLSVAAAVISLLAPIITQRALDITIPEENKAELIILAVLLLLTIVISVIFSTIRAKIMTVAGQDMIYDIRKDLYEHLQKLPFEYYDTRPHGKILTRVINYVNSVSDLLTNGLITFVLEMFNIIFIIVFMFVVSWQLALVVLAGLPLFLFFMFAIKKMQRRAWQSVSNKSSNLNAYLHEGLVGVSITQSFTREEENEQIFDRLSKEYRKSWMKAIYFSNAVWPVADNISIWVTGAIYLVGLLVLGPKAGITVGTIVAMTGYSGRFWQPIMNLSNLYNTFINTIAYLERIFDFPVNFVLLGDALYIHTAFTGKKMDLIRKNPRVGFSAYVDVRIIREKATTTFRSVCGTGTAAIVEDKEEKRTALDAITVRYKSLCPRPAPDSMINRVAIIRIDIDSLMGKYAPGKEEALKA